MPNKSRLRPRASKRSGSDKIYYAYQEVNKPSLLPRSNISSKNPVSERLLAYRAKIKKSYRVIAQQIRDGVDTDINWSTVKRAAEGAPLSELSILKIEEFLAKVQS